MFAKVLLKSLYLLVLTLGSAIQVSLLGLVQEEMRTPMEFVASAANFETVEGSPAQFEAYSTR